MRFALLEVFFIFVVFFVHAGWPTPDDSEAHYLAIAKHAWNPEWIPRDLLLNSTNVHVVFSSLLGWISLFTPLPVFAWIGRVIVWGLLAWGWRRLAVAVTPNRLFAVLSAALFVTFSQYFYMSREWSVGGLEAKGLAYAVMLFALERIVRGRWTQGLALLGMSTSVHVVVGGWATLAAGGCWLLSKDSRPTLKQLIPGLGLALLLALPGLIPALQMVLSADPADAALANKVYVFFRLPHHLWPPAMRWWLILRHALLIGFMLLSYRYVMGQLRANAVDELSETAAIDSLEKARRLTAVLRLALTAVAFSAVGLVFAFFCYWSQSFLPIDDAFVAGVMKFYWFRLSDVLCPAAAALFATQGIVLALEAESRWGRVALGAALLLVSGHLGFLTLYHQANTVPRADGPQMVKNFEDWRSISREAFSLPGKHGPARFITPWNSQTFKWYSSRSEIVSRKDIPQDAASIVEWWKRINDIYLEDNVPRGPFTEYPVEELRRFAEDYDADYVITESNPRIDDLPRVAHNGTYAVYQLRPIPPVGGTTFENAAGR